ncbi:MAG TPA: patatin-like phospholipase family protein [Firmicutes bacterium]|nr:patatin-like phospholipase family protein [Bacillota bacterium]
MPQRKADAVFEGGGVKGIGLVGALYYAESLGYQWQNVAGSSAGALVGALVAAGYTAGEIYRLMKALKFSDFCDPTLLKRVPIIGPLLSIGICLGLYQGRFLEEWLADLLAARQVYTFRDLRIPGETNPKYMYKLQVIASDISLGRMLVLPGDYKIYGKNPDDLPVALAVRMSTAIPFFYKPVKIRGQSGRSIVVDGGILSNFPVWLFDAPPGHVPPWPTFGFRLVEPKEGKPHQIYGPVSMFGALFSTMMEAHDARYIEEAQFKRTISIPTLGVQATDFDITDTQRDLLFASGMNAARKFFHEWDFEQYIAQYRLSG